MVEQARKGVHAALALTFAFLGPTLGPLLTAVLAAALSTTFVAARSIRVFRFFYQVPRTTAGELFFALGVLASALLFLPTHADAFVAGMLVLGLADPLAALIGARFGTHTYRTWGDRKTLEGSMAAAITAAGVLLLFDFSVPAAFTGGVLLAAVEAAPRGADNLLLPVAAGLLVML